MKKLGISEIIGRWIYSFLTNRRQIVKVNVKKSLTSEVKSGVPQGIVLGPLLLLIYISDIREGIKSKKNIYVDDTKIKSAIRTESDVEK